jgi:hypothetical protein
MGDDTVIPLSEGDLRRTYAKLNAQDAIIRILIHTLVDSAENPAELFEQLRSIAMDEGDILQRPEDNPNVDFIEQGRLETLRFIAETFDVVKRGRDASQD